MIIEGSTGGFRGRSRRVIVHSEHVFFFFLTGKNGAEMKLI